MFEDIENSWKKDVSRHTPSWPAGDPHHDLAAEVTNRLAQLDIVLNYVERAQATAFGRSYVAGFWSMIDPPSRQELLVRSRAMQELALLTETFCNVAWRIGEAIAGSGHDFPGFKGGRIWIRAQPAAGPDAE